MVDGFEEVSVTDCVELYVPDPGDAETVGGGVLSSFVIVQTLSSPGTSVTLPVRSQSPLNVVVYSEELVSVTR